jgi:hypothetical protein
MNYAFAMSLSPETKKERKEAIMITAGFAALMILLMLLWKWPIHKIEMVAEDLGIEIELNLPPEPEIQQLADGGGGGGNPVHAAGQAGIAKYVPPQPSTTDDSKDEEDNNDKAAVKVLKPDVVKPTATKVNENKSVVKAGPKPVVETPAPRVPKAVIQPGKTLTGNGKGGGSDDYEQSGGKGNGYGVGNGKGSGGGTGNGTGGGNGTGSGNGNGPKITRGDRKIIRYYSFEGDLDKAVIYANVNVSPEGIGRFISIAKGSSNSSNAYKEAIIQYLQKIKFDKADHESMLTVQFNFRVN